MTMPLGDYVEAVRAAFAPYAATHHEAMRQLLLEHDYDPINIGRIAARPGSHATRCTTTPATRAR